MTQHILLAAEIVSALAVLLGVVIAGIKIYKWCENIVEGMRCQLRSEMLRIYYRHKDERRIRQYEKENFIKLYESYKALRGNSFIDDIYKEVMEWDVVS